jgi:hypothetical protein
MIKAMEITDIMITGEIHVVDTKFRTWSTLLKDPLVVQGLEPMFVVYRTVLYMWMLPQTTLYHLCLMPHCSATSQPAQLVLVAKLTAQY